MILTVLSPDPSRSARLEGCIKEIANNDMTSLKRLYEELGAGVYSFALSMMQNREDAEDILQETFLTVHRSAHLYRPVGRPTQWVMTVTRNLCISRLRQRSRTAPLSEGIEPVDYTSVLNSDDRIDLARAMNTLSDEEQRVVVLHAISGLKHREIAAVLDVPVSTVTNKYRRALKKLKKAMEGGRHDEE